MGLRRRGEMNYYIGSFSYSLERSSFPSNDPEACRREREGVRSQISGLRRGAEGFFSSLGRISGWWWVAMIEFVSPEDVRPVKRCL